MKNSLKAAALFLTLVAVFCMVTIPAQAEFIEFANNTNGVAFTSDGSRAFVTTEGNYLYEVEVASREIVRSIEIGSATYAVAVAPGDRYVYAGTGSALMKIDRNDYSVQSVFNSPAGRIQDMLIMPNGEQLWFINYGNPGWCYVVRLSDYSQVRRIGIGGINPEMALRPDGSEVWIVNWLTKWVNSINTTTFAVRYVYNIQNPWSVCFSPDGEYFYVTNTWHGYMEKKRISDMSRAAIWFGAYYTAWAGAEKVFFARSGGVIYKDDAAPAGQGRAIQIGGSPKALEKNPGADELWIPGGHAANSVYILPTVEPEITVAPTSLDFGEVALHNQSQLTFDITNEGDADLNISAMNVTGGDFAVDFGGSATVAVGASQTFTVTYTANTYDYVAGSVEIISNDSDEGSATVDLHGRGVEARAVVEPEELDFGELPVYSAAHMDFTIGNVGNADLVIEETWLRGRHTDPHDWSTTLEAPTTVAPGGSLTVTVNFTPTDLRYQMVIVMISMNGDHWGIVCTGRGVTPEIEVSPMALNFGEVALLGEAQASFSVANTGNSALNVSSMTVTGDNFAVDFAEAVSIAAGASQTFTVTYSADTYGPVEGSIAIASNDMDEEIVTLQLSGTAIAPVITVDPASLDFGSIEFRRDAASLTFDVSNEGNTGGTISSIIVAGDNFACDNEGGFDLAPGASQTITVDFEALAVGAANGSVTVESNDPVNGTAEIGLTANVVWISEVTLIARLGTQIEGLRAAGNLNRGQANSLCVKLTNVVTHLNRNRANTALNMLNAFRNEVNDLMANGVLSAANGQPLIDEANFIAALIAEFGIASHGGGRAFDEPLPQTVNLAGAYPNPFNAIATIRYGMPEAGFVSLVVHDLTGRQVAKLVNGMVDAGWHEIIFDAQNFNAGVYLVRLSSAGHTETMKIALIR